MWRTFLLISETRLKFADNSFRNGDFRVPLSSETRLERPGTTGTRTGQEAVVSGRWSDGSWRLAVGSWEYLPAVALDHWQIHSDH